jgi:arylsulfate sulfotransferase
MRMTRAGTCSAPFLIGILTLTLLGCGGGIYSAEPPIVELTSTQNPLVAQFSVRSGCLGQAMAEMGRDTSYGRSTSWYPAPGRYSPLNFFVAGMRASSTYHMRVVFNCFGNLWNGPDQTFTTGALPGADLDAAGSADPIVAPVIQATASAGSAPAPGVELFNVVPPTYTNMYRAFVTDLQGNIIWYYDPGPTLGPITPMRLMDNGHFIIGDGDLQEVDLANNVIRDVSYPQVNQSLQAQNFGFTIIDFHHDVIVLPNGHWIALAQTTKPFTDLPGYPGVTNVIGDALIDIDLNGNVAWAWSGFDHLDVNRHLQGLPDWTHSNAIVYTADGNLLVSMRHQSWILKIDYQDGLGTGDILWKLGEDGDYTLTSGNPSDWFYAQHDPNVVTTEGSKTTLAIWDNGNFRIDSSGATCGLGAPPYCYSRATLFQIDESAKTASLLWDYVPGFFSYWGGSIGQLSNGNMEFDITVPFNSAASQIMEVTQTGSPQVVWQLNISGVNAYRAYRIPSLYPGITWQQ